MLPTRTSRKVKVSESRKKKDFKPLRPMFCPCKDPDTGEKCGKMMKNWDDLFYAQYGMCEKCFEKYNPNIDTEKFEALKKYNEENRE